MLFNFGVIVRKRLTHGLSVMSDALRMTALESASPERWSDGR